MKKIILLSAFILVFNALTNKLWAQSEENRNKIQMAVNYGGKTILADVNSISTTIARYNDPSTQDSTMAKAKSAPEKAGTVYLTLDIKKMSTELLKVFAKRQNKFDGTITLTDTYGKNPPRVIKFTKAMLESYSDQFSGATYNESYGSSVVALSCKALSINGVEIEL